MLNCTSYYRVSVFENEIFPTISSQVLQHVQSEWLLKIFQFVRIFEAPKSKSQICTFVAGLLKTVFFEDRFLDQICFGGQAWQS